MSMDSGVQLEPDGTLTDTAFNDKCINCMACIVCVLGAIVYGTAIRTMFTYNLHTIITQFCIPGIVLHLLRHCVQWRVQTVNVVELPAFITLHHQMLPSGQIANTTPVGSRQRV